MPPADQEIKESSSMSIIYNGDSDQGDIEYYEYLRGFVGPPLPPPNSAAHQLIKEAEAAGQVVDKEEKKETAPVNQDIAAGKNRASITLLAQTPK